MSPTTDMSAGAGAIAAPAPQIAAEAAIELVRDRYGLDVTATALVSERDQNFRLEASDGRHYVLKIANESEDPVVTEFQIRALEHIAAVQPPDVSVPAILPTLDGRSHVVLDAGGARHLTRVVSYLPGVPLADLPFSAELVRDLGSYLARLDRALADFSHPGEDQALLWDMKRALELRAILVHVADRRTRELVETTLQDFETHALAGFASLRRQIVHNDVNPGNVLVSRREPRRIAGIIDFGDMLRSPLIVELGVAAAYMRAMPGNPLALIVELIAGYHSVTPLMRAEIDMLHDLIKTRLATTVAILAWRESLRDASDAYLEDAAASEANALPFLERLAAIPRTNAQQIYSQVCASVEAAADRR